MIRKLIKKGDTQKANEKLFEFINSIKEIENECVQLINRTNSLKQKTQRGVIENTKQETTANQLTMATLYYCQELEKKILEYFPSLNYTMATVSLEEQLGLKLMGKYHKIQKVIDGSSMAFSGPIKPILIVGSCFVYLKSNPMMTVKTQTRKKLN